MIYFYVRWIGIMINKCLPIYYHVMFDIFRILTHCIPVPLNTQHTDLHSPSVRRSCFAVRGLRVLKVESGIVSYACPDFCVSVKDRHKDNIIRPEVPQ